MCDLLQRGRVHEAMGDLLLARRCYENAISINPSHAKSLKHLVRTRTHRILVLGAPVLRAAPRFAYFCDVLTCRNHVAVKLMFMVFPCMPHSLLGDVTSLSSG